MKFVIILIVVIAYIFHAVISNNYYDNGHGGPYGGGGPGGDYNMDGPYSEEPFTNGEPYGNNYCPYNCEKADSVEFSQSQAVPLGYFFSKTRSDIGLQASHSTESKDGYVFVKFLGGVFAMAQPNTCPVYYLFNADLQNSFYSPSSSTSSSNNVPTSSGSYVVNGIKFYCYCSPYYYTIPLFEFYCSGKNETQITTDFDSVTGSTCLFIGTICWILPPLSAGGSGYNQGGEGYSAAGEYHGGGPSEGGGYQSGGGGYQSGVGGYQSGGGGYQSRGGGYQSGGGGYQPGGGGNQPGGGGYQSGRGGYQSGRGGYQSGGAGYPSNNYGGRGGY